MTMNEIFPRNVYVWRTESISLSLSLLQGIKLIFFFGETTSTEQRSRESVSNWWRERNDFFFLRCKKTPHIIIIILKCLLELEKWEMRWSGKKFFFLNFSCIFLGLFDLKERKFLWKLNWRVSVFKSSWQGKWRVGRIESLMERKHHLLSTSNIFSMLRDFFRLNFTLKSEIAVMNNSDINWKLLSTSLKSSLKLDS